MFFITVYFCHLFSFQIYISEIQNTHQNKGKIQATKTHSWVCFVKLCGGYLVNLSSDILILSANSALPYPISVVYCETLNEGV